MASATDTELVERAARDYYEAWFDGDAATMERVLHPDLVKRRAAEQLGATTKERMVALTRDHAGKEDGADRRLEIEVDDVHGDIATVTVRAAVYHEYLHLVRTSAGWQIANALFEVL